MIIIIFVYYSSRKTPPLSGSDSLFYLKAYTFKLRTFSVSTVTVAVRYPANAVKYTAGFDNIVNADVTPAFDPL